ncbi:MAG: hypothetical protein A3F90_11795 [Deltaproteobacteria bacterium RIFCSPLOWO2_12_FULL_60_19]|nr:MAG: hypothetical protein A3F90_11795 [Deltaproteobacteria bacterium RIFCSPLOWO2_12_FULL_60_19]
MTIGHHIASVSTFLRRLAGVLAAFAASLLLAYPACLSAAEKTITLRGRVDVAGLEVPAGGFTVRALQPQKRSNELGKTDSDGSGNFQLTVDEEAVGVYGVVVEATSANNRSLVLEAPVLLIREAKSPIVVDLSTTAKAAFVHWKVQRHPKDIEPVRPFLLAEWLNPILTLKAKSGLKRAETQLAKWAQSAAAPAQRSTAAVLQAAVGDFKQIGKRLSALGIAAAAIAQIEEMARKDANVAYILMMPYFLEL